MKLIGIVGRTYYNKDNQEIIQLNDYLRRVLAEYEDVVPILLLPTSSDNYLKIKTGNDKIGEIDKKKLDYLLDKCDGFIVPGGTYWHNFDEYVIKYAIDNKKPMLAICLGFQCLCSMFAINRDKFDMTKKLNNNKHYGKPNKYIHDIKVINNTLLSSILKKENVKINSIHHDYIDFPIKELKISAISSDNIIEAVELPNNPFIIGLQWHPEYLMDNNSKKIFDAFINNTKRPK